jgi:hypothetical protein
MPDLARAPQYLLRLSLVGRAHPAMAETPMRLRQATGFRSRKEHPGAARGYMPGLSNLKLTEGAKGGSG